MGGILCGSIRWEHSLSLAVGAQVVVVQIDAQRVSGRLWKLNADATNLNMGMTAVQCGFCSEYPSRAMWARSATAAT